VKKALCTFAERRVQPRLAATIAAPARPSTACFVHLISRITL
jgi:hypothetical protein